MLHSKLTSDSIMRWMLIAENWTLSTLTHTVVGTKVSDVTELIVKAEVDLSDCDSLKGNKR